MPYVTIRPGAVDWSQLLSGASLPSEEMQTLAAARLESIEVRQEHRQVTLTLTAEQRIPRSVRQALGAFLSQQVGGAFVDVCLRLPPPARPETALRAAWDDAVAAVAQALPRTSGALARAAWRLEGPARLVLEVPGEHLRGLLEGAGAERSLEEALAAESGWQGRVVLSATEVSPDELPDHGEAYAQQALQEEVSAAPARKGKKEKKPAGTALKGRPIPADAGFRPIKSIVEEESRLALEGEVVMCEARELKSGRVLISFSLTDFSDTLAVKCFREKGEPPVEESIQPGEWLRVRGPVQVDKFTQELTLMAEDICLAEKRMRLDTAAEKRVELHLHTQMSAMDATLNLHRAVERAKQWGMPAIAVTDHGVVQSYPEAFALGQKHGVKILFGMEAYLVDDGALIVARPPRDVPLGEAPFVLVDIETTGLSPIEDEILEIGALRMVGGEVQDELHLMVRPSRPVPPEITKLTGITDEDVRDGLPPAEALQRFTAFLGEGIFVAHNATFDFSFLRYQVDKHLGEKLQPPVLDTMVLARALLKGRSSYSLATLTEALGIPLENHHRALSDARTTGYLLRRLLAEAKGVATVEGLNELAGAMGAGDHRPTHCTLLVATQQGLRNLYDLVSRSHLLHYHRVPRVLKTALAAGRDGLLIGSGCEHGALYQALSRGAPDSELEEIASFCDYLEMAPPSVLPGSPEQVQALLRRIYALGQRLNLPVVATGDVHFLDPHEQIHRQILRSGIGWMDERDAPLYFRTTDEMLAEFAFLGEEAARAVVVTNTQRIAAMVEEIRPVPRGLFAPVLPGAEAEVREKALAKAHELYGNPLPELVQKRLDKELKAIIGHGYAVLYLIAHKLVQKSEEDGYLVGSRGSIGSSLVATMLNITEVNPLPPHHCCPRCHSTEFVADGSVGSGYDLPDRDCPRCGTRMWKEGQDIPFETFMGWGGDKVPDIDLNFSGEEQHAIHRFTEELFGAEQVFRAGTISTIAEKTAYGFVRAWMREREISLKEAEIDRLARGCAGVRRTTGQHPGGLMVVPRGHAVEEFTPVQHPADDRDSGVRTTHFDYHAIHDNLCKLDILGHDDPTMLRMLGDLTGVDVRKIPMDDPGVLSLFTSAKALGLKDDDVAYGLGTIAVPEFGTGFVRQMLKDTLPKNFSDLVRISGLSHGTDVWLGNAQDLIRSGTCTLQQVIPSRDDIMVYLMYKGLEPALAFKIMEDVRKGKGLTPEFEQAMREKGVPEWYLESCKKIKYMFPKAHAAAYVLSSLRIAYFKVYHPREFYAVYFTVRAAFDAGLVAQGEGAVLRRMEELEKKGREATAKEKEELTDLEVVLEALRRGIRFGKVDLYRSDARRFLIQADGTLLPALIALPGLGDAAAAAIVRARQEAPFASIEDLRTRARLNKTVIELLQNHGALKGLPDNNQLVFAL